MNVTKQCSNRKFAYYLYYLEYKISVSNHGILKIQNIYITNIKLKL